MEKTKKIEQLQYRKLPEVVTKILKYTYIKALLMGFSMIPISMGII